jgi:tRNA (guanine-N7-)-methyltransferase
LRPARAALFESLLPRLALDLTIEPKSLGALFPTPVEEVRMEIGFGGGEHLMVQANANPQVGFIGVEPFVDGMAKLLSAVAAARTPNIRVHQGDAIDVFAWLPPASLARIDLLYPDPWPKRRHWKRRFVQNRNIAAMSRVLRVGGEFRFATDIADYAAWTLRHMHAATAFEWTAERAEDWRRPWPGFAGTRYEAKARQAGRMPCYLIFRRSEERY